MASDVALKIEGIQALPRVAQRRCGRNCKCAAFAGLKGCTTERSGAIEVPRLPCSERVLAFGSRERKHDRHAAAAAGCGAGGYTPVVGHDNLLHQSETEPGALRLCREERMKDPLAGGWRKPRTVVAHRQRRY